MAKKLMSVEEFRKTSILSLCDGFPLFKETYKDVMLTNNEWVSLWWINSERAHYMHTSIETSREIT